MFRANLASPVKCIAVVQKIDLAFLNIFRQKCAIFKSTDTIKFNLKISHRESYLSCRKDCTHWSNFALVTKLIIESA